MEGNKSLWREWSEETSWHGMGPIRNGKWVWSQCLWALLTLFCSLMVWVQVYTLIFDYMYGRHWTTRLSYVRPPEGIEMPNITVCHLEPWNRSEVQRWGFSELERSFMLKTFEEITTLDSNNSLETLGMEKLREIHDGLLRKFGGGGHLMDHMEQKLAKTCSGTFVACEWPHKSGFFNCCQHAYLAKTAGKLCYTLQLPNPVAKKPDSKVVLRLDPSVGHSAELNPKPFTGFEIHLNFAGNEEFLTQAPTIVQPGSDNTIYMLQIQHKLIERFTPAQIPPPCEKDRVLNYVSGSYSAANCQNNCVEQLMLDVCGCLRSESGRFKRCSVLDFFDCSISYSEHMARNDSETWAAIVKLHYCSSSCLRKCDEKSVQATVVSRVDRDLDKRGFNVPSLEDLIVVEIGYQTMQIRTVETLPRISTNDLISRIGGALGIWAGMSIITLMEAGGFLCYALIRAASSLFQRATFHIN